MSTKGTFVRILNGYDSKRLTKDEATVALQDYFYKHMNGRDPELMARLKNVEALYLELKQKYNSHIHYGLGDTALHTSTPLEEDA